MSIRVVSFNADGGAQVWHDEMGHGGVVTGANVRFGRQEDGSADVDRIELSCPACGAVSFHPVSGGANPGPTQLLFARIVRRRAVALSIPVAGRTWPAILQRIKARVEAMDGENRFRLGNMASEDDPVEP